MNTYITQLIELIDEAISKSPRISEHDDFEAEEVDDLFAQEFLQGKPEKISEKIGIEKYNFPATDKLTPDQTTTILAAVERLLRAYNWEFMFPEDVTDTAKYQFIIDNWDSKHIFCQQGIVQVETCKFDEQHCPFPGHCQVCHSFKCENDNSHHLHKGQVDFTKLTPDLEREEDAHLREEIDRFKALMKQPKGDHFIVGIHNYCDGRCHRCAFTDKCSSFALHEELDYAHSNDHETSNQQLTAIFRATSELIEEELSKKGISVHEALEQIDKEETTGLPKHALEMQAESYAEKINRWLESNQMELESRIVAEADSGIKDNIESITWFQLFIPAKISRAVKGIGENKNECDIFDAHGSAKVALIAIDECIQAWEGILQFIPRKEDSILSMLKHLSKLRNDLEEFIPEARDFIRPGFDE
ncbi:hypothetical protein KEM09_10590 [Carboxylicivirga mesophila]|uniref:C2H2-type domain-containing protein n=1 Tax=Carboxylicivirga mesophila TaxID=1166478 RepID=A0ABS5KA48_9BACT|nr:hypothetical protein [Carboxylicivirga mesophila]MBS2211855.1 hypothetical protein [Carboxylicivirga mesophila]